MRLAPAALPNWTPLLVGGSYRMRFPHSGPVAEACAIKKKSVDRAVKDFVGAITHSSVFGIRTRPQPLSILLSLASHNPYIYRARAHL
jgi:hypothetical protein